MPIIYIVAWNSKNFDVFVFCIQINGIFCEKLKKDTIFPLGDRDGLPCGDSLRRWDPGASNQRLDEIFVGFDVSG